MEQFKVMLLNKGNKVLGIFELSTEGVSSTIAYPKLVFVAALKANASSIIISHNHPSGNIKPNLHDEELTERIKQAVKLLDIQLYDHIIVTSESYFLSLMKGFYKSFFHYKYF